ncbi:MAG: tetratricopeptide repeat protein [Porticoccaceae bacterium]|nr:tetratricopeptide repeat protein [Porticoccaceae bacterium]
MANHLSEEEQIEAFKRWWAEKGMQLAAVAAILVGGFFGWQGWENSQQEHAEQGSEIYMEIIDIVTDKKPDEPLSAGNQASINATADQLKADFSGSGYAHFAALMKAKLAVDNGDLELAATELEWVLNNDPADTTQTLVTLRLARVEAARGNVEEALQMIQGTDAGEMKSAYAEAKGDFYILLDDLESAFTAYQAALSSDQSQDSRVESILRLKLSQATPAVAPESKDDADGVEEPAGETE